jgi:hypothetical protein
MKINAKINISRVSSNHREGYISIRIQDEKSLVTFFDGEMSLTDFAQAITGFSDQPIPAEVRGLDFLGKTRVREDRTIECPLDTCKKEELEQWLHENAQEEGWTLNTYLGSQNSVKRTEGKTILRYSVTKYVNP